MGLDWKILEYYTSNFLGVGVDNRGNAFQYVHTSQLLHLTVQFIELIQQAKSLGRDRNAHRGVSQNLILEYTP